MPPPDRLSPRVPTATAPVRAANQRAARADPARMVTADTRFPPRAGNTAFAVLIGTLLASLNLPMHRVVLPQAVRVLFLLQELRVGASS